MSKRKYDEINGNPIDEDRLVLQQRQQLEGLLEHGKKSLLRALKVARGFEGQKLSKRQKKAQAEDSEPDTIRLEAEVAALKTLDIVEIAETHLYKNMLKIKGIASAPSLPSCVQTTVDARKKPCDLPTANVQARLFKTGPVQDALNEVLGAIRRLLGLGTTQVESKKRLRAKDYANGVPAKWSSAITTSIAINIGRTDEPQTNPRGSRVTSDTGHSRRENESIGAGGQTDEDRGRNEDEEDYNAYAPCLASSSDSDSSISSLKQRTFHKPPLNPHTITPSDSDSAPYPPTQKPKSPPPLPKTKFPRSAPKSTTFLPSLANSGYISGYDSSASDISEHDGPQQRKNRMGQQARRALWEKRFGSKAKHLKNAARMSRERRGDEEWDVRRGARGGEDERGRSNALRADRERVGRGGGRGRGRGPLKSGANSETVGQRKVEEKPLHPSWEAKRRGKEMERGVAFQGRKVVFD